MSLWTPVDNISLNPSAEEATAKWKSAHGKWEIMVWSAWVVVRLPWERFPIECGKTKAREPMRIQRKNNQTA